MRRPEWKTKEDMWSSFYSYLWCAMQRSPPILVCNVWVRALANQHRDHFIVAIFCRMMQTVLAFGVDNFQKRCRSAEQKTDNANMTLHAGQVKRNVPLKKECFYICRVFLLNHVKNLVEEAQTARFIDDIKTYRWFWSSFHINSWRVEKDSYDIFASRKGSHVQGSQISLPR